MLGREMEARRKLKAMISEPIFPKDERLREVLELSNAGYPVKQIAQKCACSESTVKRYRKKLKELGLLKIK